MSHTRKRAPRLTGRALDSLRLITDSLDAMGLPPDAPAAPGARWLRELVRHSESDIFKDRRRKAREAAAARAILA